MFDEDEFGQGIGESISTNIATNPGTQNGTGRSTRQSPPTPASQQQKPSQPLLLKPFWEVADPLIKTARRLQQAINKLDHLIASIKKYLENQTADEFIKLRTQIINDYAFLHFGSFARDTSHGEHWQLPKNDTLYIELMKDLRVAFENANEVLIHHRIHLRRILDRVQNGFTREILKYLNQKL